MKEEVKNWWSQAQSDLDAARDSLKTKHFEWACFQTQQSVEKALKALLLTKAIPLFKTHDLVFLAEKASLPEEFKGTCKELTVIYLSVRYPDTAEIKSIEQKAEKYIYSAEAILQWIKRQL